MDITTDSISIGGNRNPAAADWDSEGSALLAFGADNGVALWEPQDSKLRGVHSILNKHTKAVNAVKFFPTGSSKFSILLSGSADHSLRIWRVKNGPSPQHDLVKTVTEHQNAITRISTLPDSDIFATGASDGTIKIWKLVHDSDFTTIDVELLQTIILNPRYFPLSLALARLDSSSMILAVAGTKSTIQIFISKGNHFELSATLSGHEGWIRALDFTRETLTDGSDLLLASASQDKYIRLWRVHRGEVLPAASSALNDPALGVLGRSLSNKAHRIESKEGKYSITFEALLLGHEDWIYTASWRHRKGKLQLLSTSEDNSLAIWEADETFGVWVCTTRLGEISAQKGSTTATGSAGGFWIGLWSPDGDSVVSLGRTGSWRKWTFEAEKDMWVQQVATTGHVREVKGVCWSRDGSFLLSTGSDQTTRLFAEWKRYGKSSWHEFSRPQIHGYDLNCIDAVTDSQFITGADEKLLRVFDEPRGVAEMLKKLCNIQSDNNELPDAANIPVLGLSNKAIQTVEDDEPIQNGNVDEREAVDPGSVMRKSTLDFDHPPFEDHLARHLLWPESEKLYGHGYEISAVATSNDGRLVATACRASSIDHAVIRLYDTKEWFEIKPSLKAHSLTVTALQFSPDDKYLLSVGRDRQWVVWEQNPEGAYVLRFNNLKGHTRMILGAAWTALEEPTFLTVGRDKTVKIWQLAADEVQLKGTVKTESAVTAVHCNRKTALASLVFAYGTEDGQIAIGRTTSPTFDPIHITRVDAQMSPARTINQLAWRPKTDGQRRDQLAVVSDDSSVRIYGLDLSKAQ
ncbi:RNA polymeras-like protein II Elongator subunit [Lophiostoma macrostomum CBS 122681]|uniref:Elongator complex protein 2 n=1 Tax=Lophiostoma macrostomum CBS 122681 TaxID=1314788 RepID=A0A6A6T522_9PLEO|nr:RNA polymeras-like protein II Elongator subunit [Lophiostoma macrostomum CBS 122681]